MALIPSSRYPAQIDTDGAYPQGKARNAGSFQDGTGTPLEKDWVNDIWGFLQALLDNASITPSGDPDEVGASDYLDGVTHIAQTEAATAAASAEADAIAAAAVTAANLANAAASKAAERIMLANWSEGEDVGFSDLRSLAWIPAWNLFVLTADIGDSFTSPDGQLWTAFNTLGAAYGVAGNPSGTAVAVYSGGVVQTSTDGSTWTNRTSGTANELLGVTWTGTQFIAVGASGTVITSPTGTTWTTRTSGTAAQLQKVASSDSLSVAVGLSGTIITSADGVTWTTRTSGTTDDLFSVAWSPTLGIFAAVGEAGTLLTSADGITWTARTSGTSEILRDVKSTDNYVIAVGANGALIFSADGISWQLIQHSSAAGSFNAVALAWSGLICVAAGSASDGTSHSLPRLPD